MTPAQRAIDALFSQDARAYTARPAMVRRPPARTITVLPVPPARQIKAANVSTITLLRPVAAYRIMLALHRHAARVSLCLLACIGMFSAYGELTRGHASETARPIMAGPLTPAQDRAARLPVWSAGSAPEWQDTASSAIETPVLPDRPVTPALAVSTSQNVPASTPAEAAKTLDCQQVAAIIFSPCMHYATPAAGPGSSVASVPTMPACDPRATCSAGTTCNAKGCTEHVTNTFKAATVSTPTPRAQTEKTCTEPIITTSKDAKGETKGTTTRAGSCTVRTINK